MMKQQHQQKQAAYDMTCMLDCINKEQPEQALFYMT